MSLLDRKLLRDVRALRGQVITIALLVASGVAVLVGAISTFESLSASAERFYDETRYPEVFAALKRAPLSLVSEIAAIPGVAAVEPRIVREVILDLPSASGPVSARMISLAPPGEENLSGLYFRSGMAPEPGAARTVAINEAFSEANKLGPGDEIRLLINGRVEQFRISGVALSPEYVYAVKPGLPIPDDRSYAVVWADRSVVEAAFDMKAAFNDVVVSLAPGAGAAGVIADLDRILEPFGSVGAIGRRDQPSNRFLQDELRQQKVMSTTIPLIFFGVAVFLLNTSLGRLVAAQREQIAALKALGFSTSVLSFHFLKFAILMVAIGSGLGLAAGFGFGHAMIWSYQGFFRLPDLAFRIAPWSLLLAVLVSLLAAGLGVMQSLYDVVRLAPAVAMRPAIPAGPGVSWIETLLPARWISIRGRMTMRNATGRPLRTLVAVIGIGCAVPMMVLGLFWRDAIGEMIDLQFGLVERGNVSLTFLHPVDRSVVRELRLMPGVLEAEGQRIVPVRIRAGSISHLTTVTGLSEQDELRRPHDIARRPVAAAPGGITLARRLAERLKVTTGETVTLEVMEGRRRTGELPVSAVVDEAIGTASYMEIEGLNRFTDEGAVVSAATLYVDPGEMDELGRRLKELPSIESVTMKASMIASFMDKIAGLVFVTAAILAAFATIITVGVVYNSARISFQERAWELASLRVLGFTRHEVAAVLYRGFLIEITMGVLAGLPLAGFVVRIISEFHSNESFQIPAVIAPRTYLIAAAVVLAAALASAFLIKARVDALDPVAALKTRE